MKVLCIVQARMDSKRLPGKVMKKIANKYMISYTLNSLRDCRYIDEIVVATSILKNNDILCKYVKNIGFNVFRGSEENVLKRYKNAADKYSGDIIVRITGDCPLISPLIIDNVITKFLMYDYDYLRLDVPNTFQRGFDTEVFSKKTLDKVYSIVCSEENLKKKEYDKFREHVTYYIYTHNEDFKIGYVKGEDEYYKNRNVNLSVDTVEDFRRVQQILENRLVK
ncbi:glycosyltransferase family protein [uncultured Clostridium sp.]|uniref:glycosyltransferase family protein n=1 Tax=uncultured Clostridium sp. TaxID=59620 RepID=UPI0025D2BD8C|nr:glycosyltransferase family protein [uncultured Clostridium sp.]